MSTYAIGDVQGCFNALQTLLQYIDFKLDKDKLIFLGDVVNRGNQSLETLRFIKSLNDNATMVLGNHDFHLLACALKIQKPNKKDTFNDILDANDKNILIDFLLQQDIVIKKNNSFFVHAGIPPIWDAKTTMQQAKKITTNLQKDPINFIQKMYGNNPKVWHQHLPTIDDMRYSVNGFMRMRFCDKNGKLNLIAKDNFTNAPKGYKAWFLHSNRLLQDKIYFGHWSNLINVKIKNIFPMDFGYIWGKKLACIRIEDNKIFSIS